MPRKKEEFKPLTLKRILKVSPQRKSVSGGKSKFKNLLNKALKTPPFDKR